MKNLPRIVLLCLVPYLAACDRRYSPDDFVLAPSSVKDFITVTTDRATLPADGFSRATITAQITSRADADKRTVTFTTTAGTLVGQTRGTSVPVTADAEGRATVMLESSRQIESAIVRAQAGNMIQETRVAFVAITPGALIVVTASDAIVPADGRTTTRIVAQIAAELPADRRRVEFISSVGTFAESGQNRFTATADSIGRITAELRSSDLGTARVQAQVDGVVAETLVDFVIATPEQITVSPERFFIPASATQVTITARLIRARGTVTPGTVVTFTARTPSGDTVGHFSGITTTDERGVSVAQFSAERVIYRGPVRISVAAAGVTGSTEVEIVDP